MIVRNERIALTPGGTDAGGFGIVHRLPQRDPDRGRVRSEALHRRVADSPARPVDDARQRHGVVGVVDHDQVGDRIADLGPLVEARAADHLVGDLLPNEHVLEHARLRVRAVEDRELVRRPALLDVARDLGGDEPGLCVLVLGLDDVDRIALTEVRPEVLRLAVAVVVDDLVRGREDRVGRAVVLLERN